MLIVHIQFQLIYFCGNRNLVDAANIAALAALLTFRRPECSLGGKDGQKVIVHPPEVRFLTVLAFNISVFAFIHVTLLFKKHYCKMGRI